MKRKISVGLFFVSVLAVLMSVISVTFVYYNLFKTRIMEDLRIHASLLSDVNVDFVNNESILIGDEGIRITVISPDGGVLYDNDTDPGQMENHLSRPEVISAKNEGEGNSVRWSETMQTQTYNYAMVLENGNILRVSTEVQSIISVFISSFPMVYLVVIIILIICLFISHYLTKRILKPIEKMTENLDRFSEDVEYKELEPFAKQIRKQHEDILLSAKVRQDFTANVSHELKTPLTAISGYAELIEQDMIRDGEVKKSAGQIRENSERLLNIINDTIKLSELDYEGLTPELSKFDLYELSRERADFLRPSSEKRNIKIEIAGDSTEIFSDKSLMTEALDNLIQNAIRYNTDGGLVTVSVFKQNEGCVLKVADSGVGIPPEEIPRIFERFYRVDKSRSRETGGTGLGLAIVKHITELLGYTIQVESEVGKGTVFTVYI